MLFKNGCIFSSEISPGLTGRGRNMVWAVWLTATRSNRWASECHSGLIQHSILSLRVFKNIIGIKARKGIDNAVLEVSQQLRKRYWTFCKLYFNVCLLLLCTRVRVSRLIFTSLAYYPYPGSLHSLYISLKSIHTFYLLIKEQCFALLHYWK